MKHSKITVEEKKILLDLIMLGNSSKCKFKCHSDIFFFSLIAIVNIIFFLETDRYVNIYEEFSIEFNDSRN
jgi:hypothetical protein